MRRPDQRPDEDLHAWRCTFTTGDYGKDTSGKWWASTPDGHFPALSIAKHEVIEHPDGTITVKPSILAKRGDGVEWHGFLEKGVWRTCS